MSAPKLKKGSIYEQQSLISPTREAKIMVLKCQSVLQIMLKKGPGSAMVKTPPGLLDLFGSDYC